jgi:hypothetical protein
MDNMFKTKKQNNITKGVLREKRSRKRAEAEARQKKYDALTLEQKIARAVPGSKEHTRLLVKASRQKG